MGNRVTPFGKDLYIERTDFFDLEGKEGAASGNKPQKGFKRLLPGDKVRLRYAYVIQCDEVIRNETTGEPIELKCTYFPETRAGVTPEGEARVEGIIHWVEASKGVKCQVNQYDRLFLAEEPGKESGDFLDDINPNSLEVLTDVVVEPSVAEDAVGMLEKIEKDKDLYHSELAYQFERSGYFALDPASTGKDNLVFNRVVTLRDTWGAKSEPANTKRTRGEAKQQMQNQVVEDIRRVALRAATILDARPHPEADSLLVCRVDCGDMTATNEPAEPRTVVAGLAGKIPVEELIGRKVVCLTNLKPAKMRGIESTAMLLAASDGGEGENEKVELLSVPDSVPNGELVSFQGKDPSEPDEMLKSKGAVKVWDRVKSNLKANENGEATYVNEKDIHVMMTSAGPVKTTSLVDAVIQ
jgi:methionine--tRNA ligase beta chain